MFFLKKTSKKLFKKKLSKLLPQIRHQKLLFQIAPSEKVFSKLFSPRKTLSKLLHYKRNYFHILVLIYSSSDSPEENSNNIFSFSIYLHFLKKHL